MHSSYFVTLAHQNQSKILFTPAEECDTVHRQPVDMIQSIAVRQSIQRLLTGDTKLVLEVGIKLLLSRDSPSAAAVQVDLPPKNASPSGIFTLCLSRDAARLCRSAHQGAL